MSSGSGNYYSSSNPSRSSRGGTNREEENRDNARELPRLRDVLREQFDESYEPAYNLRGMGHALPQQSSRNPQASLRLPPIRESSLREDYGYNAPPDIQPSYLHDRAPTSSRIQNPSRGLPTNQPTYHVLAPSSAGGSLVPVSTSYTKPPGIVRGHVVTAGLQGDDSKKRFECQVCGRKMERQSVYNQHMLTHTDVRPHACSYCPKTFNSKSNLNRHMLTHTSRWTEDSTDNYNQPGSSSKGYFTSSRRA